MAQNKRNSSVIYFRPVVALSFHECKIWIDWVHNFDGPEFEGDAYDIKRRGRDIVRLVQGIGMLFQLSC